ncbi:MAG: hypothetical protein ACRBG0_22045 [Lewinella sp.]|uniref:hypothetical protein n=1 Tax=Lewinella sp. TaxID=2004506 RepID=UPI003D6A2A2A
MIDSLATEVDKTRGALPLLSFTLSELYDAYIQSGRTARSLTEEDYHKKGASLVDREPGPTPSMTTWMKCTKKVCARKA